MRVRIVLAYIIVSAVLNPASGQTLLRTKTASKLRREARVTAAVVTIIPAETELNVKECHKNWCRVSFYEKKGYVSQSLLVGPDTVGDEMWEARWTAYDTFPDRTDSIVFRLRRSKRDLTGYVSEFYAGSTQGRTYIEGFVRTNKTFYLESLGGIAYAGQFTSDSSALLTPPNQAGGQREWARVMRLAARYRPGIIVTPDELPPTSQEWSEFLKLLRTAIASRDRTVLSVVLTPYVTFHSDGAVASESIISLFDDRLWRKMECAVRFSPPISTRGIRGRDARNIHAVKCAGYETGIGLAFAQDRSGYWRLFQIWFPGD